MNRINKYPAAIILFLTVFYASALNADVSVQYVKQDLTIETAYLSTFSLPDKSRAIIKKYFPNIQLEVGEVPEPYHHSGRKTLLS